MKTWLKIGGPLIVLLLLALFAYQAFSAEARVGVGADVVHNLGEIVGVAKVGHVHFMAWESNAAIGVTNDIGVGPWQAGVGLAYAGHTNEELGTRTNFLLYGTRCWGRLCLGLRHLSHGKFLGIEPHRDNDGINLVTFEKRL